MLVFVTRDKNDGDEITDSAMSLRINKPTPSETEIGRWMLLAGSSGCDLFLAAPHFKQLFGFTPRKGSCKQMELSLKEVTK